MAINQNFVPFESNGAVPVNVQDQTSESVDLYLYRLDASPTLTGAIAVDDTVLSVNTNANISNGDAITIYEGENFFQSIVANTTANSITISTPSDTVFTVAADVEIGPWNMAVDGSETIQTFYVKPPPGASFDIYTIRIGALDDLSMDATTFAGIVDGIANGFLIRQMDGTTKNLGLFQNNLGMEEFGFAVTFYPINKKSEYGMVATKNMHYENGVAIRLEGSSLAEFDAVIRDDLSSQSLVDMIISGHVVTN